MKTTEKEYLETFGLMCAKCEFHMLKVKVGLVEKIMMLLDESKKFEEFHFKEALRIPIDIDYWGEEVNGSWYEAVDLWLDKLYTRKIKMMKNTKIEYMYRDASNYKQYGEVVVEEVISWKEFTNY